VSDTVFRNVKNVSGIFLKFGVLCERDCYGGIGGFSQTKLVHKILQQNFLKTFKFWYQLNKTFATDQFGTFLGSYTHSGLHELHLNMYRKFTNFQTRYSLETFSKVGLSNGSIFGCVYHQPKTITNSDTKELPAKVTTFIGIFILSGNILLVSLVIFVCEVVQNCND